MQKQVKGKSKKYNTNFSKYFFTGNHILSWMVSKEPSSALGGNQACTTADDERYSSRLCDK